jgi:hypothetical protein
MLRKTAFWIVLCVALVVGGEGYAACATGFFPWLSPGEAAEEETVLQTAEVTVGDLSMCSLPALCTIRAGVEIAE